MRFCESSIDEFIFVLGNYSNVHRSGPSMIVLVVKQWRNKDKCWIFIRMQVVRICRVHTEVSEALVFHSRR